MRRVHEDELAPWLRTALRLPNHLYDIGFGAAFGHRFLRLTHTGRRSGRRFHVVLEVLRYDPVSGEAVVVSGLGRGSDWLRNLRSGGPLAVDFGHGPRPAAYRVLPLGEAEATFTGYLGRHRLIRPLLNPVLNALLGWRYDGSPEARRRMLEELPLVALRPAQPRSTRPRQVSRADRLRRRSPAR